MNLNQVRTQANISIQGYLGSFHHKAATALFGEELILTECATFYEVVQKADNQEVDYGLMAIENSIAGSILPNYQLLKDSSLKIVGEIYLKIGQHLMALAGQSIHDIQKVYSHHMALKQADKFLNQYPFIQRIEIEDTALAAKRIKEKNSLNEAAIAGDQAAALYGLEIIAKNIETVPNNFTRFLLLSKTDETPEKSDKCSLLISLKHSSGTLAKVLTEIAEGGYNLSKIQSFPIIENEWEYYFILDIEGINNDHSIILVEKLREYVNSIRILGTYLKGKTI